MLCRSKRGSRQVFVIGDNRTQNPIVRSGGQHFPAFQRFYNRLSRSSRIFKTRSIVSFDELFGQRRSGFPKKYNREFPKIKLNYLAKSRNLHSQFLRVKNNAIRILLLLSQFVRSKSSIINVSVSITSKNKGVKRNTHINFLEKKNYAHFQKHSL